MPSQIAAGGIGVVTLSYRREQALARCVASVAAQQAPVPVRHYVFSEEADLLRASHGLRPWSDRVAWMQIDHPPRDHRHTQRVARLRQPTLAAIAEPYVAYLDDDNEMLPGHLDSLHRLLHGSDLDAAYSWRTLVYPDGSPYEGDFYPWHPNPARARELHRWCVAHGVIVPGDAVVYDGPRAGDEAENVATVDMNEWLFRTGSLRRLGFDRDFSDDDVANQIGEDDKLLQRALAAGMRIAPTRRPTIRYTLGGLSNRLPDAKQGAELHA
jgi:hypothetical protein